jgi:hypothetical protein
MVKLNSEEGLSRRQPAGPPPFERLVKKNTRTVSVKIKAEHANGQWKGECLWNKMVGDKNKKKQERFDFAHHLPKGMAKSTERSRRTERRLHMKQNGR